MQLTIAGMKQAVVTTRIFQRDRQAFMPEEH
uniref:Uncharacterized protein n=1 Tax=Dunaliella salina TaxID=3046 RepID=L7Z3K6_DUNSA|nr:hypothetical protein [Dunaliella salina]